jgi:two-component system, sensor histidine kinase and response regulator
MAESTPPIKEYVEILLEYLKSHSEEALYRASLLGKSFLEAGVGPDEITAIHCDAVSEIVSNKELLSAIERVRWMDSSSQFLLEFMVAYGAKYKEHLDFKLNQSIREAEAKLAREREIAELALAAERDKIDILSIIAHELSTPLTAARGNVSVAARLASAGRLADLPPVLGTATSAIERLTKLTANLMAASQGMTIDLEITRIDLRTVFDTAYEWANALADEKLVLIERSRWNEPIIVKADVHAMLTVFGNIFGNAVRYTPRAGQIVARDSVENGWGCFEITDTGIGMTPETIEHIFEKFYRSSETRHMEPHGLGIGLYIAHELVEAHGGRIEVESARLSGSTFRVYLPLAE